jgi:hypothetical protein
VRWRGYGPWPAPGGAGHGSGHLTTVNVAVPEVEAP